MQILSLFYQNFVAGILLTVFGALWFLFFHAGKLFVEQENGDTNWFTILEWVGVFFGLLGLLILFL